jgi:hypothetical protein
MEGALAGTLRFGASRDRQSLAVALSPGLAVEGTAFNGVAITGTIGDLFGNTAPNLRVRAAAADFDGFDLQAIDATAQGPLSALTSTSKRNAQAPRSTRATLRLEREPTVISLAALNSRAAIRAPAFASPVDITLRDGRILIPTTRILAGGGSVTLQVMPARRWTPASPQPRCRCGSRHSRRIRCRSPARRPAPRASVKRAPHRST